MKDRLNLLHYLFFRDGKRRGLLQSFGMERLFLFFLMIQNMQLKRSASHSCFFLSTHMHVLKVLLCSRQRT